MVTGAVLVLQISEREPIGRLGDWLTEAGLTLDIRPAERAPSTLDDYSALIVLGSPKSATNPVDLKALAGVLALLRAAVSTSVPTLGICLGAQLLAVAHGGRVEQNPDGPELGAQLIAKRSAAARDPLFGFMPITPDVVQWHFDAITVLPPAAIQLASSPGCDQQAFRLGRLAWGLQFHFETTAEIIHEWAAASAVELADYDLERIVERAVAVLDDVAEVWQPFAAAFAEVVRDPDSVPAPGGFRVSTAAPVTDPVAIRAALAAEMTASRASSLLPMPGLRPRADG